MECFKMCAVLTAKIAWLSKWWIPDILIFWMYFIYSFLATYDDMPSLWVRMWCLLFYVFLTPLGSCQWLLSGRVNRMSNVLCCLSTGLLTHPCLHWKCPENCWNPVCEGPGAGKPWWRCGAGHYHVFEVGSDKRINFQGIFALWDGV